MTKILIKNDKYKKTRGGYSRLLKISCHKYGDYICLYQKDGHGNLRRMYVDRINASKVSVQRKDLSCKNGDLLGVRMIYKKEQRPAYRLFVDSITKKIVKA